MVSGTAGDRGAVKGLSVIIIIKGRTGERDETARLAQTGQRATMRGDLRLFSCFRRVGHVSGAMEARGRVGRVEGLR